MALVASAEWFDHQVDLELVLVVKLQWKTVRDSNTDSNDNYESTIARETSL